MWAPFGGVRLIPKSRDGSHQELSVCLTHVGVVNLIRVLLSRLGHNPNGSESNWARPSLNPHRNLIRAGLDLVKTKLDVGLLWFEVSSRVLGFEA